MARKYLGLIWIVRDVNTRSTETNSLPRQAITTSRERHEEDGLFYTPRLRHISATMKETCAITPVNNHQINASQINANDYTSRVYLPKQGLN